MKKVVMQHINVKVISIAMPAAQELDLIVRVSCCSSGRRCTMPERVACVLTSCACSGEAQAQVCVEGLVQEVTAIGAGEEGSMQGLGIDSIEVLESANSASGSMRSSHNEK